MKLSLSGEGNCARSYRSQMGPGVTNQIGLGFKPSRSGVDMLVLLLQEAPQVSHRQVHGQVDRQVDGQVQSPAVQVEGQVHGQVHNHLQSK